MLSLSDATPIGKFLSISEAATGNVIILKIRKEKKKT